MILPHPAHNDEPRLGTDMYSGMTLRSYQPSDHDQVVYLYHHGLLTGVVDPTDPATDLDHIDEAYLAAPQNHFWVVEAEGRIVGTVALNVDDANVAHIRRLRVDPAWKTWHEGELARRLIFSATRHAQQNNCLRLVLHTPVDDERTIHFLQKLDFQYARSRDLNGRRLLEFYVNLYSPLRWPSETPRKSND